MKRLNLLLAALATLLVLAAPAGAVTDGEFDGEGHPYVGLMVAKNAAGQGLWRCSGTLISPTLFLTAGHCTEAPAASAALYFDADVQSQMVGSTYPTPDATGSTHTHPDYDPNAFFLYDLGIVVLDQPVQMDEYGALPGLDSLDELKKRKQSEFTAVGYGLQRINPAFIEAERVRMVAYPHLLQINGGIVGDFSLLLSNNASTGGTCFGDSGGPNFLRGTNTIAGVTSFGLNGTCGGTGGVYRVDRADDLNWIATFTP